MTHYTNSIEYRFGDDGLEYTYEEFQEWYKDKADEEWEKAGNKEIKTNFNEEAIKYKLYIYVDYSMPERAYHKVKEEVKERDMLKDKYKEAIEKWNSKMTTSKYPDAGFDLFTPLDNKLEDQDERIHRIDFSIRTAMYEGDKPVSFTMHPRSSIYKTPFRLTNNTGIIDSGYRGNLGAVFDVNKEAVVAYKEKDFERYVQICAPSLERFKIELVESDLDLGLDTERGVGGFGSTGR